MLLFSLGMGTGVTCRYLLRFALYLIHEAEVQPSCNEGVEMAIFLMRWTEVKHNSLFLQLLKNS